VSVVSVFSGSYCRGEEVAVGVARELDYKLISDDEILDWASNHFDFPKDKLRRAMYGESSVFSKFTRDKERAVAYLNEAAAEQAVRDNLVHHGFAGHLMPASVSHIIKVCLVADQAFRIELAAESEGLARRDAKRRIEKEDLARAEWTKLLFEKGPWDKKLYDIKIPMHSTSSEAAITLICSNVRSHTVETTTSSKAAMDDFLLSARVKTLLVEQGHDVEVTSEAGDVTVAISKYVLRLDHLREQFRKIGGAVAGVKDIQIQQERDFRTSLVMSRQDIDLPAKVLLVDDEKEFVQALSERLQMRDVGTAMVYDGEQALSVIDKEEPEVMILDLRMPGIDGIEVLRRVKKTRPQVEVIILTGHGSEKDQELAMELGAFAYLEKPVDIQKLTGVLREAYEKVKRDREASGGSES
jgi:two-component system, OmpR family, response regulator CpxR